MKFKLLFVVLWATLLVGCATNPNKGVRMVDDPHPVKSVVVLLHMGNLLSAGGNKEQAAYWNGPFKEAMKTRLPDILKANGIGVGKVLVLPSPPKDIRTLDTIWKADPANQQGASHILVITGQSLMTSNRTPPFVRLETVLYEPDTKRLIWQGHPDVRVDYLNQPKLGAQYIGRYLLNEWKLAQLVTLEGEPKDLEGKEMGTVWVWENDR